MKWHRIALQAILICGLPLAAQEVIVTTPQGEAFLLEVSQDRTIADVVKVAEVFTTLASHPQRLLIEVDLDNQPCAETVRWDWSLKKHGQYMGTPRDFDAPLTQDEQNDIRFIITFLANRSLISIAAHRLDLEEAGDRIDRVHPLKFLMYVFTDEELKVGIRNIRGKGWVWGDFVGGLKESLATEARIGNLQPHQMQEFARQVKVDHAHLAPYVDQRNWDEFIDTLIVKVPRAGDHGRFDS